MNKAIEQLLFASRWLLAPVHMGLVLVLLALLMRFVQELYGFVLYVPTTAEAELILAVLTFIELFFIANLLIMMMISGYENFAAASTPATPIARPGWAGSISAARG